MRKIIATMMLVWSIVTYGRDYSIVKEYEGLRLKAYRDGKRYSIGYGTKSYRGERITRIEAEKRLWSNLEMYEKVVLKEVKVEINDEMIEALTSFCYNVGPTAFRESTLLRLLNDRAYVKASVEFENWVYSGGKEKEWLVKRRKAEQKLFLKGYVKL